MAARILGAALVALFLVAGITVVSMRGSSPAPASSSSLNQSQLYFLKRALAAALKDASSCSGQACAESALDKGNDLFHSQYARVKRVEINDVQSPLAVVAGGTILWMPNGKLFVPCTINTMKGSARQDSFLLIPLILALPYLRLGFVSIKNEHNLLDFLCNDHHDHMIFLWHFQSFIHFFFFFFFFFLWGGWLCMFFWNLFYVPKAPTSGFCGCWSLPLRGKRAAPTSTSPGTRRSATTP